MPSTASRIRVISLPRFSTQRATASSPRMAGRDDLGGQAAMRGRDAVDGAVEGEAIVVVGHDDVAAGPRQAAQLEDAADGEMQRRDVGDRSAGRLRDQHDVGRRHQVGQRRDALRQLVGHAVHAQIDDAGFQRRLLVGRQDGVERRRDGRDAVAVDGDDAVEGPAAKSTLRMNQVMRPSSRSWMSP